MWFSKGCLLVKRYALENMAKDISVNERCSLVHQPRHPHSGLPTCSLERKSFDFTSLSNHSSPEQKQLKKKRPTSAPQPPLKSPSADEIRSLIDNDEQFFEHLKALKEENSRNLVKLNRIYSSKIRKRTGVEERNAFIQSRSGETFDDSLSEDELDEKLKVKVPSNHVNILPHSRNEFRGRSSSYDVIANMWQDFDVDRYVPYSKPAPKPKKAWSPTITIPEPFEMTIREEKQVKQKSKRIQAIEEEKLLKRLREEAELQKCAVPTPIPASTFLPMYEEIRQQQQKKREYVRNLTKQILKSSEKPFSFIKREKSKKLKRSQSLTSLSSSTKDSSSSTQFLAKPFPKKLFSSEQADKKAEQEEYRRIRIRMRAQETLARSSLPGNMKTRPHSSKDIESVKQEIYKEETFRPRINKTTPDFNKLQKKFLGELEQMKNMQAPTAVEPFNFKTDKIRRPSPERSSTSTNNKPKRPQSAITWQSEPQVPTYSLNETTRLRQERLKKSLERQKLDGLRQSIDDMKKRKEREMLQKKLTKKIIAQDLTRKRDNSEKINSFKEADFTRRREYEQYLKDIDAKLQQRPLLFERELENNAKLKAQRRYEDILKDAGVDSNALDSIIQASIEGSYRSRDTTKSTEDNRSASVDSERASVDDRSKSLSKSGGDLSKSDEELSRNNLSRSVCSNASSSRNKNHSEDLSDQVNATYSAEEIEHDDKNENNNKVTNSNDKEINSRDEEIDRTEDDVSSDDGSYVPP